MRLKGRLTDTRVRGVTQAGTSRASVVDGGFRSPDEACAGDELARLEASIQQLERAELYVVSAIELDLHDRERRLALHRLRCEVLAVCDVLRRPTPLR